MGGAGRRVVALTRDTVADLQEPCARCRFWTHGPAATATAPADEPGAGVDDWLGETLLQWGSCGQIAYVAGVPVAHALYAPPAYLPGAAAFPTSPATSDAVVLARLRVQDDHVGEGLGRMMIQAVARDLVRRNVRTLEAFGWRHRPVACLVPADFLLAVGFRTVRAHPTTPRLRMELRSTVTWREDVESAWDALVGSLRPTRPAQLN